MNANRRRARHLWAARWLLAAAIFGSTMAIGGVHLVVLAILTVLLLASVVLAWAGADPLRPRRAASLVLWTGVGLTLWTAIAILPLPPSLLAALSPHAADIWARALTPLDRPGPAWVTLSVDPGATRVQVLRGVAYVLAFLSASRIAARREGVVFLERAICVTAVALALAAVIHPALGADKVFGIYTPRNDPGARHIAPLLNSNVLAGYVNIGIALLLGQLFAPRSLWPRTILAAVAVALVGFEVWVASRGGVIGTGLAVVLVGWMSRSAAPERAGTLRAHLLPGVFVLAGIGMIVLAASDQATGELGTTELSKLDFIRETFRIVPAFPVFGVGRGAFESVFPAYRADVTHLVYTHPENLVSQWVTEWGVVPACLALTALLVALRPASATTRSPRAAGAWGAILCVAIHDLVNFGTEYPAVVIALATCAAIVTGGTSGLDESRKVDAWARRPLVLVSLAVVASVAALLLARSDAGHELFDDRKSLRASALDPAVTRQEFEQRAEVAMLRHPAEPFLPFTGALRAVRVGDTSPLPWIERTLDRAIVYGPAHLLLARWLTTRSPSQARLEYRLTLEQAPELTGYVSGAVTPLIHGYDDATELLPAELARVYWMGALATAVASRLPATARRLDELATASAPDDPALLERRATEAMGDLVAGIEAPWCVGEKRPACTREALRIADRVIHLTPTRCSGYATRARILLEDGDAPRALRELQKAGAGVADRVACFEALADLATLAKADDVVTSALGRISHAGCSETAECVVNLRFVAQHEMARGNERSALSVLERAREKAPEDDGLVEETAALAAKLELPVEAMRSYQTLAQRHPEDPRWPAAITAQKLVLTGGSPPP